MIRGSDPTSGIYKEMMLTCASRYRRDIKMMFVYDRTVIGNDPMHGYNLNR